MSKRVFRTSHESADTPAFVLKRSGDVTRTGLLLGTALGCSIAIFSLSAPTTAWATNECGPLVASGGVDQVTCAPGSYPSGITYNDPGPNPVIVTLGPGADPSSTGAVFVEDTGAGAYAGVVVDAGSTLFGSNVAIGAYTTGGGDVFVKNYGSVTGDNKGIYAVAIGGGNVNIYSDTSVLGVYYAVQAKTGAGNIVIDVTAIGENSFGASSTVGISGYAVKGTIGTSTGYVTLTAYNGYATGISTASTYDNTTQVVGSVNVTGYTGALGVKTSSAYNAVSNIYGDVTVTSGIGGLGGGNATGVISVGSNTASTYVLGNVTVTANGGVGLGVESVSFNGSSVDVTGNVIVNGSLGATGIYTVALSSYDVNVNVGGNVYVDTTGGTATGVLAEAGTGAVSAMDISIGGSVHAYGYTSAVGIDAVNNSGTVDVNVGGDVVASAIGDATGIHSYAFGQIGLSSTITVGGDVFAASILGNATGIDASAYGALSTIVGGDVTAIAYTGTATGIVSSVTKGTYYNDVHVYGSVSVSGYAGAVGVETVSAGGISNGNIIIGGDVSAQSVNGEAFGVLTDGYYNSVTVGGNVTAYSERAKAIGVYSVSHYSSYVNVGGNVTSTSKYGTAYGIAGVVSAGNDENTIIVGGSVKAIGYNNAYGVVGQGGDVNIQVTGDVTAQATQGNAIAAFANGDAVIYVGGNARATSFLGNATAVYGNSSGYLGVHVGGNVYAGSYAGDAIGIQATAQSDLNILVDGDVTATSFGGNATGVQSYSYDQTFLTINGNVSATSFLGNATGVNVSAYDSMITHIGGSVYARSAYGEAIGVKSVITEDINNNYTNSVIVGGDVTAIGATDAIGVYLYNEAGDSHDYVHVGGNVTVKTYNGYAIGVAVTGLDANISVGKNVYAYSENGKAFGISAVTYDNAISVGGNVTAISKYSIAVGVQSYVLTGATNSVSITGNVDATGYEGAIGVVALGGEVSVNVGGSVTANSFDGNATGVFAEGYNNYTSIGGNVSVIAGGTGTGVYSVTKGDNYVHVAGTVNVYGFAGAYGVKAAGGNVTVDIGGDAIANSIVGNATAVYVVGDANITIGGNAIAQSGFAGNATAVYGNSSDYLGVHVGGSVGAYADHGYATGVNAYAGGNLVVNVGNNVVARSGYDEAIGIVAASDVNAYVTVGGDVYAKSFYGDEAVGAIVAGEYAKLDIGGNLIAMAPDGSTIGAEVLGGDSLYTHVGGSIGSYAGNGTATGLITETDGYNHIVVGGNVTAIGKYGAVGVEAISDGDVNVHIDGSVYAKATDGNATGVFVDGDSAVYIGGDATAISGAGRAIAVEMSSGGLGNVVVKGDVGAQGTTYAIGVSNVDFGYSYTSVGGNVQAVAGTGQATGIFGYSEVDDVVVDVTGHVAAGSSSGAAYGVIANASDGFAYVNIGGNVAAIGSTGAAGVSINGAGYAEVTIGGNVTAVTGHGTASGVTLTSGGDGDVSITGSIGAYSKYGNAYGVSANVTDSVAVTIGGNVDVASEHGNAYGVRAIAGYDSDVYITGNVLAQSKYGEASGVYAIGTDEARVYAGGVVAESVESEAFGVYASSGNGTVVSVASVLAEGNTKATGVYAFSSDGYVDVTVAGSVGAISTHGDAIGVHVVAYTYGNVSTGNVGVKSYTGNATGIFDKSGGDANIYVNGNVMAVGAISASGVYGNSTDGVIDVTVTGNVVVQAGSGGAFGVEAVGLDQSSVTVHGNVSSYSVSGTAFGVVGVSFDGAVYLTVDGSVYAKSASGTGAVGVDAQNLNGNSVVVEIDGPVTVKGHYAYGVVGASLGGGDVTVSVGNVSVFQYGATSLYRGAGIFTYTSGTTNITADVVYTAGNFTDGVRAGDKELPDGGDTYVTTTMVETTGANSNGVYVYGAGNATIHSGTVYTKGDHSDGIYAYSSAGGVNVTSGNVKTLGNYSAGIYAAAGGPVVVTSGTSITFGAHSDAVDAINTGVTATDTVKVYSTTAVTHGDYSDGIFASGYNSTYVKSNLVKTYGYDSTGILAQSTHGPVTIVSNAVHTYYTSSDGIVAFSGGNATVTANVTLTDGNYSFGIFADASNNVTVNSTYVRTLGYASEGIVATAGNAVNVASYEVKTYGDESYGINARATNGNATVSSTFVYTGGNFSTGIAAYSDHGDVVIDSGTVITVGDYSDGIHGYSFNETTTVNSTYVKTYGYHSEGIYAYGWEGATVNSGTVKTYGNYADGIHAISNNGMANVTSTFVLTEGTGSVGIYAYGVYGANVNSNTVKTYGDFATGIVAVSSDGIANVTSHYVQTVGDFALGISAYGYYGASVNNVGLVRTYGYKAGGIVASAYAGDVNVTSYEVVTYGDYSRGIAAETDNGNVTITVGDDEDGGGVFTYGYASDAVYAVAFNGSIKVTNYGTLKTTGDFSDGVFAASVSGGNVYINNYGTILTAGFDAFGVYAFANGGTVDVYNGGTIKTEGDDSGGVFAAGVNGASVVNDGLVATYGDFATAIDARALTGDAYVVNEGVVYTKGFDSTGISAQVFGTGTAKVVNGGDVITEDGVGIYARGTNAEVYNYGYVSAGFIGVDVSSTDGSYIYNKGTIKGGNGFAIYGYGASVYIENKGRIYGYAILNSANNTVDNHGIWNAYGNSYFGYGNDVFNNHGIVAVTPHASVATTTTWSGLTVFNNANLVDLRNGHTGDIFNLVGNGGVGTIWNGLAGSTLGVDASLSAVLTSDRMNIGAANGSTALVVNDTTPTLPGTLNFVGTTVVHATSGSASNFTWVGRTKGFINYELEFFSGPVDWNIVALPSNAAFELLKAPEMAQDFWRRTGDAWSAREQEVRDSMWGSTPATRGEGWEMWAQAQIGGERLSRTETFDVQGQSFSPNLGTDSDWRGFQMGGDNWTSKNWLWGFTGGFLEQNTSFHFDHNSFDITGWNVGAYTGFTSGHFFANGLIKGDWFDLKANMHTVPALETFSGDTWGAKGEMGFRWGSSHLYFEPLADLAWTSTHLDNANFTAQDTVFTFGNATSLRGSIGARIGGQWGQILPYVGLYAAQEFDGKNKTAMITGGGCTGCEMDIQDLKPGSYERADFGFTTTSWNGLEGFLKGEAEFGGHTDGFTGRLGVRWRW